MPIKNKKQKSIKLLEQRIKEHLPTINKPRINLISEFIIAVIQVCTVNLTKVAIAMPGETKMESRYRRLQRFFAFFKFPEEAIARFVAGLVPVKKFKLSLDRTNWKFGQKNINILVLGIVYKGICFPVLWRLLNKQGNSNTKERKELINKYINIFGKDSIECLLADREFIGYHWFNYLISNNVAFFIRIRQDFTLDNTKRKVVDLFRNVGFHEQKIISHKRYTICGHKFYLAGTRTEDDYMIIITLKKDDVANALEVYLERWGIETLFGCLNPKGLISRIPI